jgi:TatD DNase family protein
LFFNFHTHIPGEHALVSAAAEPENAAYWSLERHPWYLPEKFVPPEENFFENLARAAALGEIGLDRLRGPALSVQREYFNTYLSAAQKCGKPVVIHAVRCDAEVDSALKNFNGKVLIHGFRGGNKRLQQHLEFGRFVSFAPGAWRNCTDTLKDRGLTNIGLETDDSGLRIEDVYIQAESETGISGWQTACQNNFLRFIGAL